MKPIAISILLSVFISQQVAADDTVNSVTDLIMSDYEDNAIGEVKAFCENKWPSDFVMQKHCIDEAITSRNAAQELDLLADKDNMIIWSTSLGRWKDTVGRTDWNMANHCIQEQLKALAEIK